VDVSVEKQWSRIILFIIITCSPLYSQTNGKIEAIRLFEKDVIINGENRKGPYLLPDSLIIKDSEKVFVGGELQNKERYELDFVNGELRFKDLIHGNVQIRILYKRLPFPLKKSYYRHPFQQRALTATMGAISPNQPENVREQQPDYASKLSKSGSITRGVTMGSDRGLKLNSSLNLNVSGKVADNVEVLAALTDQTTPIQPEGTTQNLQEIDKVFVQINAPHLSATMGDYQLSFSGPMFAQYNRKLQGALGKVSSNKLELTASGAVSKGKYLSMQLMGQEGFQGPYQLKGDRGQIDIIILAGTERVYIDGESMVRGETNDYIIDYTTAQITFTRRRLITSDSRIVVDFQYSDEKFRRNMYSLKSKASLWGERIKVGTTFLKEVDDKQNPLEFSLTEETIKILKLSGDDPQKAVLNGAKYTGPNKGYYVLSDDSSHFVFRGKDLGDYLVSFADVGQGNGDYEYKGIGQYEFVGKKNGRYGPVILLTTAKSHQVVDFDMELSPVSCLSLSGEMAVSSVDQNLYSSIDDADNQGIAQNWILNFKPDSLHFGGIKAGKMQLSGKMRSVQDRFQEIDRSTEIEYNRRWDLPELAKRGEQVHEFQGLYEPYKGFSLGGEYGNIKKGDYFKSNRWQFENRFGIARLPNYTYRIERIKTDHVQQNQNGDWMRQRGQVWYTIWKLKPLFDYEGEIKKENWSDSLYTGFKFDSYTAGIEVQPVAKLSMASKFSFRDDKVYIGMNKFQEKTKAVTQNYQLNLREYKSFAAQMEFTHRSKSYSDTSASNTKTDLAEMRVQINPWKRALNASWNYQISNTATAKKERVYIKVSRGDGNYLFDEKSNEYVNDPLGDYILRIFTTDEFVPVVELKTSSRLRLDPFRFWGQSKNRKKSRFEKIVTALSSETYVAIEERTQEKDVWEIYLLNLSHFQKEGVTIFGNRQLRQDLFLFENNRDFSIRVRSAFVDEKNNQFLEGGQDRLERENSVRITARFSNKSSSQTELIKKRTARFFHFSGRQNRDIYSNQLKTDISFRPINPLEVAIEARLALEEDRNYKVPTKIKAYSIIPHINYAVQSKGRLRGEVEWSYVAATPGDRVIPYEMADGRSLGRSIRWDLRFDYRFSQTIQATIAYTGRNEPERGQIIHSGRAQVTAAFQ
jgi:hypothetical protein